MTTRQLEKILKTAPKTVKQFIKKFCGEKIGEGCYRDVYIFKPDDRYVVKIEKDPSEARFANVTEWRNWIENKEWVQFSKYLAPCEAINETGQILVQRRVTRHIDDDTKKFPKKIPSLFTDLKYFNFGWIGDQFVCYDYSFLKNVPFKMRTVRWRKY